MSSLENVPPNIAKLLASIEREINEPVIPTHPVIDLVNHPKSIDVGDRTVKVLASIRDPQVVVLGDLLSADECDAIIELSKARMQRSTVLENNTGGSVEHTNRTSFGGFLRNNETDLVARVEARIARLINWPADNGEGMQVLRYSVGAEYQPHHDWFDPALAGSEPQLRRGGQRLATVVMYLNDTPNGGGTWFPTLGLEVLPHKGSAVFFSYKGNDVRCLHGGSPVLAGEKWAATKWYRENLFT
jgi:prolyl 4-hydroxylase